jgi:signal transduction histidine kinase
MNFTIYRKMVTGFAVVICIMIAAHAYVLFELHSLSDEAQSTLTLDVRALDLAKRLRGLLDDEDSHARKYLITRDRVYYDLFQEASREFQKQLTSLVLTEAERGNLLHRVAETHSSLSRSLSKPGAPGRTAVAAANASGNREREDYIEFIDRSLKGLIRMNQLTIDGSLTTFVEATHRATIVAAALTVLTILAASLAAWMIARTITRPIGSLVQATQQIARGRFEPIRVHSHDETALLAGAVNEMSARLRKTSEAKADLMHQIVHELRNPLQVIFVARNLLADQEVGTVNGKQLEMLDLIGSNTEKLMSFTNQFLDLAKIDAGMMEYRRTPIDLVAVVARAVEDARALASRKDISIALSADAAPQTLADGEKLSQVFGNLLSNAIKYTERSGSIEVSATYFDHTSRVVIRDSGIGIAAGEIPKLFDKFYQATNASATHAKGTGLGLALVKAFVEGHGGTISVASTLGVGSIFTVELPLADIRQGIAA